MLIHRLSQQLSHIVGCRVPSPCQSTEHSTTCCSARTLIRSYPDSAGFRSKGKAHSTAPTQRLYRGTHKIHLKKLLLTNNLKAQTRQRVSSTIILWMLDVEYLPPVRATNSRLENAKSPITSRVFCACRSAVVPFFLLHLRDFSFIFLLLPILPVALANSLTRYWHFHYSIFFSELKCNSDRKGHSAF